MVNNHFLGRGQRMQRPYLFGVARSVLNFGQQFIHRVLGRSPHDSTSQSLADQLFRFTLGVGLTEAKFRLWIKKVELL